MKLATWNLERGGKRRAAEAAQAETIRALRADVLVLTEPPASYRSGRGMVTSPARRRGERGQESWVAITGPSVEPITFDVPYERLAVAARAVIANRAVIVYGSVLPWLSVASHAPDLLWPGETSFQVFIRVLAEQAADVAELRRAHGEPIIWTGDLNQTLSGPNVGGSPARRSALQKTLAALRMVAWNETAAHAHPGMCAIDLICGSRDIKPLQQGRMDPMASGIVMSDHAGYWVEL